MPRARASHQPGTGCCYRRGKARIRQRSSGHEVILMIIPEFYCRLFVARVSSEKGLDLRTQGFWVSALSFLRAVSARRGEPPKEPPDSTIWARLRGRPVPPPSRPGQQFRARRYWHEYRANHRNSPSAFRGRAHRMAQAAHGLFRPMVVAWQKRPGCVRIAVTGEVGSCDRIDGPVDRSGQVIDEPGCLPSAAGFHTWRATRRKLPPMIAAISAAG